MDLSAFSPEQLQQLKIALDSLESTAGRSPFRDRQLHDLRLLPTKDDPRPTFFWSAEPPRHAADLTKTTTYPRLMWEGTTGREITIKDAKEQATYTAQGFVLSPPANAEAPDPMDVIRQQLETLSPEDRKAVMLSAQAARLTKIQEAMAGLSETEMAALVASLEPKVQKRAG